MADQPARSVRLIVGLAILTVGLTEAYTALESLRAERRLWGIVVRAARADVVRALPGLREGLGPGGMAAWEGVARMGLASGVASEVEVLRPDGTPLLSVPTVPPVAHRPSGLEVAALATGQPLTATVRAGPSIRVLTYVPFEEAGQSFLLRLATAVPDLEKSVQERPRRLLAHLLSLAVLLLAGAVLFVKPAGLQASPTPARVLDAYEEAMGRLRDHGLEMSREHEAERHRMEAELRDQEAMARAGELTAGIVHEVRNGLGTILGYARIVERTAAGPEVTDAALGIREECESLERVVRRFMDYVQREALNLAPMDLRDVLRRVAARESRNAPGALVSLTLPEHVLRLVGDEELLERMFENLVRNARQAAGERGQVLLAAVRDGEHVVARVEDDGPGLPAEVQGGIRPFFTTRPGGLGLGLPLANKIVRLHRGELLLQPRSPRGLAAQVTLPAAPPDSPT